MNAIFKGQRLLTPLGGGVVIHPREALVTSNTLHFAPMYATRTCKVKTDRRDARALAEACLLGAYRPAHRLSDAQRPTSAAACWSVMPWYGPGRGTSPWCAPYSASTAPASPPAVPRPSCGGS